MIFARRAFARRVVPSKLRPSAPRTGPLPHDATGSTGAWLALQRSVGNHSVLRILQSHASIPVEKVSFAQSSGDRRPAGYSCGLRQAPIMRVADSAARPALTSPRFAGDPVLEACHQDQARLDQGTRGAPVEKVQQALADLGFDLGPKGVDAVYGPSTAQAVRRFKAREKLGFEQFGDVGPGTITRLDQLFPGAAPAPDLPPPALAGEEDDFVCPAPDDIVTAAESVPELNQALAEDSTAAPVSAAQPVGAGASGHLSIDQAITRFKQIVDVKDAAGAPATGPATIRAAGQFFGFEQLRIAVEDRIRQVQSSGDADAQQFSSLAFDAIFALKIGDTKGANARIAKLQALADRTKSRQRPAMQALLRPAGAGGSIDERLFAAFDADPNSTMPRKILDQFRTLRALKAVRDFDAHGCGGHALRIAKRIKRKGGLTPRANKAVDFSAKLSSGTGVEDMRPMGSPSSAFEPAASGGVSAGSGLVFGDFIVQSGTSSIVGQIRRALDAGRTVHARVLSGVGYGVGTTATGKLKPDRRAKRIGLGEAPEEHSILIIGFDGDTFVFHDPAATVSKTPEAGFGLLHFDSGDNRLSTAANAADLAVTPADGRGDHRRGDKRYQVIRVETQ